jgi:hypothetical protein
MADKPQSEKLKALGLRMHQCGRLYSAKPGAFCKKCGPDEAPTVVGKTCKKGHAYTTKRCNECAKASKSKRNAATVTPDKDPFQENPAPVMTDEQRAANREAAEKRSARRAGEGRLTLALV